LLLVVRLLLLHEFGLPLTGFDTALPTTGSRSSATANRRSRTRRGTSFALPHTLAQPRSSGRLATGGRRWTPRRLGTARPGCSGATL
jgi:hypothetical protein